MVGLRYIEEAPISARSTHSSPICRNFSNVVRLRRRIADSRKSGSGVHHLRHAGHPLGEEGGVLQVA